MVLPLSLPFSSEPGTSTEFFGSITPDDIVLALIVSIVGYIMIRRISSAIEKSVAKKIKKDKAELAYRFIYYPFLMVLLVTVLSILHINITSFVATAGILGIILGLAAQSSVSNVISGIFLLADDNFEIGDIVEIDEITGVIVDIGFMFTKIRTWDNLYVTLPNKAVAESKVTNLSRYDVRRILINFVVNYDENIEIVRRISIDTAHNDPDVVDDPKSNFVVMNMDDDGIKVRLEAWVPAKTYWPIERRLTESLSKALQSNNIEIPYPQRVVHMTNK